MSKETLKRIINLDAHPLLPLLHSVLSSAKDGTSDLGSAIVAGGFPRDILLGKEPRDIDVFIPIYPSPYIVSESTLIISAALAAHGKSVTVSCSYYENAYAKVALDCDVLQFILTDVQAFRQGLSPPECLVRTFDTPLCEAWMVPTLGGFEIHVTEDFDRYAEHKVLGFYPEVSGDHSHRLIEKFPDYLAVDLQSRPKAQQQKGDFDDVIPF